MTNRASIAVACLQPAERASVSDWLSQSGYDPVAVSDLSRLDEDLHTNPVEALIAEMALVPREDDVRGLMRRLGSNRPLMILGDASRLPKAVRGDLSVINRPLTREGLLLSVGLALAEGRPARRFPRRDVEPIPAVAHGMAVTVREASVGGVGLEVTGPRQAVLPPYFELRVACVRSARRGEAGVAGAGWPRARTVRRHDRGGPSGCDQAVGGVRPRSAGAGGLRRAADGNLTHSSLELRG